MAPMEVRKSPFCKLSFSVSMLNFRGVSLNQLESWEIRDPWHGEACMAK